MNLDIDVKNYQNIHELYVGEGMVEIYTANNRVFRIFAMCNAENKEAGWTVRCDELIEIEGKNGEDYEVWSDYVSFAEVHPQTTMEDALVNAIGFADEHGKK